MKGSFKLGSVAGIGVFIHWTFTILIAFIIYFNFRSGYNATQAIWSVLFIVSIFGTVFFHELGHALAAKHFGFKTIDITFLPIGGMARLEKIPEKPFEELVVAIAGPLVNVAFALITRLLISVPESSEEWIAQLSTGVNGANFFLNFYIVNLWLAVFNLIPAFPMDGGRILRALLSFKLNRNVATRIAARLGQFIAVGFIILGFFNNPFLVIIGLFVIMTAQMESEYVESKHILKGYKVRDVTINQYQIIESGEKLKKAIELLLSSQYKIFLIMENGEPVGTLNRDQIILGLANKGEDELIYNIMDRNLIFLDADAFLENVFEAIYSNKTNLMLVTENNLLIGVLDTENLLEFILIKQVEAKSN
jgi:Zn-dependent protease